MTMPDDLADGRPKTVLFCSQTFSPIGGVEEWLDQLCDGLDRKQWRPIVALVRGLKAHDPDRFRAAHPRLETVDIDGRGLPHESRVRAVMRCVQQIAPAIFVPLVVADAHLAAARLRHQSRRLRYLFTLHGNTVPQLLDARLLLPFSDLAVAPGALTVQLMGALGMPVERLRQVPNGARPVEHPQQKKPAGAPIRLGYVGRLTQGDKRVGDLVPFVQALAATGERFELTIAGDGPERASLVEALAPYPVTFLGALTPAQLYREVFPSLDVLLLFSESEAFGIAIIEAMQHGVVPVTSAFVGAASEAIVEGERTGFMFPVGDAVGAADAVRRLSRDPQLLASMSRAARKRVMGRYAWSRCVSGWSDALHACLDVPPRSVPAQPVRRQGAAGRLERLGIPPAWTDAARRLRRAAFGVPGGMVGGEEWPWAYGDGSAADVDAIAKLRIELDRAPEVQRA